MTIETIQIGNATDDQLSVSLKGSAAAIIQVLVNGLPHDALRQINDAIAVELDARRATQGDNERLK